MVTAAHQEALARVNVNVRELSCIEFRHPTFPNPVRWVEYDENITLTLEADAPVNAGEEVEFQWVNVRVPEIPAGTEPGPTAQIELAMVSGDFDPYLRAAVEYGQPIAVTTRVFAWNVKERTFQGYRAIQHLELKDATLSDTSLRGTIGYNNDNQKLFPSSLYDPG